jgi:hypothetical protein
MLHFFNKRRVKATRLLLFMQVFKRIFLKSYKIQAF